MNRLVARLSALRAERRKALSLFVTAGYSIAEETVPLVIELVTSGADVIELGIPFSDPIADGPTIQASSEVALRNGITLERTLEMVKQIRERCDIPLVLMGYANPIFKFGLAEFLDACKHVGADGTIIADLPLEESDEYRMHATKRDIASIFLVAPTTTDERLEQIDRASTGFLYCISVTGVTGGRKALAAQAESFLIRARKHVKSNPLLAGFGIATPNDARRVAMHCDGIIIGSALIELLGLPHNSHRLEQASAFVRAIRTALDS
ncbi:MAG: tryptophan synthase subunit alpha [Acidobacteria bacterium]|nr:tryptophan synthase subunit alpha [Acidobacteriota bacterium]